MWRLFAIVLPLALDSFAVAASLAAGGLSPSERRRVAIAFPAFETGMPLAGLALGRGIATAVGHGAPYVVAGLLALVGFVMVVGGDNDDVVVRAARLRGLAFIALLVATSLDELALGFTIGLLRLSLALALPLVAVQAVVASQLGLALGARIGVSRAEIAERFAGVCLIAVGALVLALDV